MERVASLRKLGKCVKLPSTCIFRDFPKLCGGKISFTILLKHRLDVLQLFSRIGRCISEIIVVTATGVSRMEWLLVWHADTMY